MKLLILTLFVFFITVYGEENKPLPCNCRLSNLNRIVEGKIANNHSIPWMASLGNQENGHLCGGTIVNERYIMTAALCLFEKTAKDLTVRLGVQHVFDLNKTNIYNVAELFPVNFTSYIPPANFALIKLDKPIKFEPGKIEPACLNFEDDNFEDDLLIAGWGDTVRAWIFNNETEKQIRASNDDGNLRYYYSKKNENCSEFEICTKPNNLRGSLCHGDIGGPLMQTKKGKTSVIGINSNIGVVEENGKYFTCSGYNDHARLKLYKYLFEKDNIRFCTN